MGRQLKRTKVKQKQRDKIQTTEQSQSLGQTTQEDEGKQKERDKVQKMIFALWEHNWENISEWFYYSPLGDFYTSRRIQNIVSNKSYINYIISCTNYRILSILITEYTT